MSLESHYVPIKPITPEGFAPYGWVFTAQPGDPDGRAITLRRIEESDFSGGRPVMALITYRWREFTFTHMEQHASFTQAFLPADGKPAVVVVAPPVAEPGSPPDLAGLAAFLLDGTQGIMFRKGIWHCPLYPLSGEATYAMTTCLDTPKETEGYLDVSALAGRLFRLSFG